ncbi:MAG TPA: MarR family winged helix-turn-helix transcriptional regulator [Pseudonocardiaceae bacterium]|nr:MarR family winged helix-turn-helix transcriptional regulator [Pseudonocardiaceae bacterium]
MTNADTVAAIRALARASRILERVSGGLNPAQYRVLSTIASGDERASRVAARLALGKPTISATVDSLCQRGLLTRTGEDADQRVAVLRLTDAGREQLDGVEAEMVKRIDDLRARTPGGEQLVPALVWLGKALDDLYENRINR